MKKRLGIVIVFLAGVVLGILGSYLWQQRQEEKEKAYDEFKYGVVSSTLQGTDIRWAEYPQFRTVEFCLHGELVIELPEGAELVPEGLVDSATFGEVSRETKQVADGGNVLTYDKVTYLFENAQIKANLPNVYGELKDATYGYELSYVTENENMVMGYIVPMCNEFHVCSKEQTANWEYPQNLEFGLLKLSRTYLDKDVTRTAEEASGIVAERIEDTYDIILRNNGDTQWGYSTMVASLEVWNQGIWMELETIFGDPAMGTYLQSGESKEYLWTESMRESLPYQAPGIYRIVVHGAFDDMGTFAVTESFVVE